jgi:hypothetical protein
MKNDNQMIILKKMVFKQSFDCHFSLEKSELKNINHSVCYGFYETDGNYKTL